MTFALFSPYISPAVMLAGMWWFCRNVATKDDLKEIRSDVGQLKVDVAVLVDRGSFAQFRRLRRINPAE